ncbi:MAG TPA: hypothetical protein VMW01_17340 [Williamwhitmania sp.]|nr:hypothetical protein [Williamwhitmania sp.]
MKLPLSHYFNINKRLNSYGVLATWMGSIFQQNFIPARRQAGSTAKESYSTAKLD